MFVLVHVLAPGALGGLYGGFFSSGGLVAQQGGTVHGAQLSRTSRLPTALHEFSEHNPLLGEGYGTRVTGGEGNFQASTAQTISTVPTAASVAMSRGQLVNGVNAPVLDDQWLKTLLETGILGVLAWVWLFVRAIRRLGARAKTERGSPDGLLPVALAAALLGFAIQMGTYDAFSFVQATALTFILIGFSSIVLHLAPAKPDDAAAAASGSDFAYPDTYSVAGSRCKPGREPSRGGAPRRISLAKQDVRRPQATQSSNPNGPAPIRPQSRRRTSLPRRACPFDGVGHHFEPEHRAGTRHARRRVRAGPAWAPPTALSAADSRGTARSARHAHGDPEICADGRGQSRRHAPDPQDRGGTDRPRRRVPAGATVAVARILGDSVDPGAASRRSRRLDRGLTRPPRPQASAKAPAGESGTSSESSTRPASSSSRPSLGAAHERSAPSTPEELLEAHATLMETRRSAQTAGVKAGATRRIRKIEAALTDRGVEFQPAPLSRSRGSSAAPSTPEQLLADRAAWIEAHQAAETAGQRQGASRRIRNIERKLDTPGVEFEPAQLGRRPQRSAPPTEER